MNYMGRGQMKKNKTTEEPMEEVNTNTLQNEENWKDWEDEADVRPIYNDAQMLNGSFEGDSIHQIAKKHQKKKKK